MKIAPYVDIVNFVELRVLLLKYFNFVSLSVPETIYRIKKLKKFQDQIKIPLGYRICINN